MSVFHTYSPINNNEETDRTRVVDLTLQAFRPQAHCVSLNCLAKVIKWREEEARGNHQFFVCYYFVGWQC